MCNKETENMIYRILDSLESVPSAMYNDDEPIEDEPEDKVFAESKEFRRFINDFDKNVKTGKIKLTRVG